jgi:hypothetical protein
VVGEERWARRAATGYSLTVSEAERIIDGRYRVEKLLGKGGMGAVYEVVDQTSGSRIALKQLRTDDTGHTRQLQAVLRFRREFHTIAGLSHPSIVRVHDYGIEAGAPYYTMELLEGGDLRDMAPCDPVHACRLLRDVASALALLHARRLLHRDLKPQNVRTDAKGRARLIDFGVLATVGVSGEVAGTLPSIPPEALRGLPLDGRADLFGLGALAYWLLTGRHAYPARTMPQLEQLWASEVPPPSTIRDGISPAIDSLVMSLLATRPEARPSNAADVVAAIEAAAGIDPDPGLDVARGWLMSASMVGREPELRLMQRGVEDALDERGSVIAIEAPTGLGKTRLAREAGLEAQVAGMIVVHARGRATEPYAVMRQIARGLLRACPAEARTAAAGLRTLGTSVPELARATGSVGRPRTADEAEERLLRQAELRRFVLGIAKARPLGLVIDDVQRSDEPSAALLATLARDATTHGLFVVVTVRTDERATAPDAIAALRSRARRVALEGLREAGVRELCRALFGEADGIDRLAEWMHKSGGGSPLHTTELAQHLVDRNVLRYEAGAWRIPDSFDGLDLPQQLAAAVQLRIEALGSGARRLGRVLSLVENRAQVELCHALCDDEDTGVVFASLDELLRAGVLLEGERGLEFVHDAIRDAFQRLVGRDEAGPLHLRIAAALEDDADNDEAVLQEVGWHYLRGGDRERGAEILERAGRRLYDAQSFADATRPLEAALEVYEATGAPRLRTLALRQMLTRGGVICGHETVRKHAPPAIAEFADDAGLVAAERVGRVLGGWIGLAYGFTFAFLRWVFTRSRRFHPLEAITSTVALVNYAASVHSLGFDLVPLRDLLARIHPLRVLRHRVPGGAYRLVENFYALAVGHYDVVTRNSSDVHRILDGDRLTPLADIDRELGHGASWFMEASVHALGQDPRYLESVQKLEESKLKLFELSTFTTRAFFHRLRGEEARAEELIASSRDAAVQLGNAWVVESQLCWISAIAYGTIGDALGMKRTLEQLVAYEGQGFRFERFRALLEGEYARVRGDLEGSLRSLAEVDAASSDDDLLMRGLAAGARVDTLLAADDAEQAAREAERGLALAWNGMKILPPFELRLARGLALAWSRMGKHADALAELEQRLLQAEALASPLLLGVLHEAAAMVAHAHGDETVARRHAQRASRVFGRTANPVLIARGRRLFAPGSHASLEPVDQAHTVEVPTPTDSGHGTHRNTDSQDLTETDILRDT